MALKRSSEVITISTTQDSPANTFTVNQIDLQLNPLDQEVFVVTGVKIDFLSWPPVQSIPLGGLWNQANESVAISTTRPATMPNLGNSSALATASRFHRYFADAAGDITASVMAENGPIDTPDSNMDYIGICATSDMFLSINSSGTSFQTTASVRVYGYRAKADAATYAALVQSEVLSA